MTLHITLISAAYIVPPGLKPDPPFYPLVILPVLSLSAELLGTMPPPASLASLPITPMPAGPIIIPPTMSFLPPTRSTTLDPLTSPLLLSSSFSPIPAKLVSKARSGAYVVLKEFLGDNIALVQRLDEIQNPINPSQWPARASPRMRDISSPIQWAYCFLTCRRPLQQPRTYCPMDAYC